MKDLEQIISEFVRQYTDMDILGIKIHCPYWMNKLKDGRVIMRGFENGKGDAKSIQDELIRLLKVEEIEAKNITIEFLQKYARRHRVGIDCSGLAYRFLDLLVRSKYTNATIKSLDEFFLGGISKTNVFRLIGENYSIPIKAVNQIQIGDLIATKKITHVLIVIEKSAQMIKYIHASSRHTKEKGVHVGEILVKGSSFPLNQQNWREVTNDGESYNDRNFHPEAGDGIYRLKIFN